MVIGILLARMAGRGRAYWSLMLWFPFQILDKMERDAEAFPLIGKVVNNAVPWKMDLWHFNQWMMRIGLMGSAMFNLVWSAYFTHEAISAIALSLFVTGVLEGNFFKFNYHYFMLQDKTTEPAKPLKKLFIPWDLW